MMPPLRVTRRILFLVIVICHHAIVIESLPRWISLRFRLMGPGRLKHGLMMRPREALVSWISPFSYRIHTRNICRGLPVSWLSCRGGSDSQNDTDQESISIEDPNFPGGTEFPPSTVQRKPPHTSDVIRELDQGSLTSSFSEDSLALRDLVTSRTEEYLQELQQAVEAGDKKLPHPRKLLHYLAPKVPAIRQSPDVNLRIHSSRSDIDSGIAACIISNLAQACEMYDKEMMRRASKQGHENDQHERPKSVAPEITTDRRFEQLVECVISGVNVQKRKAEYLHRQLDKSTDEAADIEEVLDEEHSHVDEGLNIRDSCRAAWGISVLGAHHLDTMGGVKVKDLLLTLSLTIRELLLARLQLLRQDDILNDDVQDTPTISTEERLSEISEELAKDAATAMWAFACVKACTGMQSPTLFEACCSLLCQDPVDLRRRAQEAANYGPGNPSIGSSDVIDRLARSEDSEDEDDEEVEVEPMTASSEKDVLLSWLSPTEVNDVLWALALHGSNTTALDDEIPLSDTAASLRDTAYDRMLEWLEADLKRLTEVLSPPKVERVLETYEEPVTLEVVDAAALLASQESHASSKVAAGARAVPVENLTVHANTLVRSDGSVQEVEVVDAARLLASANSDEIEVETEVIVAPMSVMNSNTVVSAEAHEVGGSIEKDFEGPNENPLFSPHDLASIAWSVTELRDPLKMHIVGMVIEIFAKLGYDGLFLSGADLSNLAWAIAKYEGRSHDPDRFLIMLRIAEHTSRRLESDDILRVFQPPELGRVSWAMASVFSTHSFVPENCRRNEYISQLARRGLRAAASNLSLFSTEDLVRIAWAFLEVTQADLRGISSSDVKSLGQILATTDMSLRRWERGECGTGTPLPGSHSDGSVFSSLFGRPRINQPILELVMGSDDDDEGGDGDLAPLLERSKRPKLRDLSIDPSTLCKAACNFQRLSSIHPNIKGGWAMTRVAVRLLSSKNGRLMRECSIHDLVRLCEATILSEVDGHGRELIIGLFARQVVAVLNEALDEESRNEFSIDVRTATSSEIATFIWSLGELGVKVLPPGKENHLANKKMQLLSLDPFLSRIDVEELDLSAIQRLVRGLVLMKVELRNQAIPLKALKRIEELLAGVNTGKQLCGLAESVGLLKESLSGQRTVNKKDDQQKVSEDSNIDAAQSVPLHESVGEAGGGNVTLTEDSTTMVIDGVLMSIATIGKDMSSRLTATEIRRLLEVYSLLPFQADALIDSLAIEVSERSFSIKELSRNQTLNHLLFDAKQKATVVKSTLYEEVDKSFLGSIRSGFRTLFGSNNEEQKEEEETDEENVMTEEIDSMIQAGITATSQAADRAMMEESALRATLDDVLKTLRDETSFELGRSLELIENYRRIEFSTGKRRTRYDRDRRNDIAKRVLSRLFP